MTRKPCAVAFAAYSSSCSLSSCVGRAGLAEQDDRADHEHQRGDRVDQLLGQERRRLAEADGDTGLHEERQGDADPDEERTHLGRHDQRRDEGLVGELDDEDGAEGEGHDEEIDHRSSVSYAPRKESAG